MSSNTFYYMSEKSVANNPYNAVHVLHKTLEFLNQVNTYIEDAQNEEIWKTIKADRQNHANLLKEFLFTEMKENKF